MQVPSFKHVFPSRVAKLSCAASGSAHQYTHGEPDIRTTKRGAGWETFSILNQIRHKSGGLFPGNFSLFLILSLARRSWIWWVRQGWFERKIEDFPPYFHEMIHQQAFRAGRNESGNRIPRANEETFIILSYAEFSRTGRFHMANRPPEKGALHIFAPAFSRA